MARYSLIMKDNTYMKLMEMCLKQGVTMGRLLNNIVDAAANPVTLESKITCHYCELIPTHKGFKDGVTVLLCDEHFLAEKEFLEGWKEI